VIGLEEIADARRYLAALDKMGRNGEIFIRRALGEKLRDLGSDYGVSSERIRSIECATRRKLLAQEPEEEPARPVIGVFWDRKPRHYRSFSLPVEAEILLDTRLSEDNRRILLERFRNGSPHP